LLTGVAPAMADLTFTMTLCGGSYQPCDTTGYHRQPTPEQIQGLNEEAFYSYFSTFLPYAGLPPFSPGMFAWTITGSTSSGIVIGRVDDISAGTGIHTGFVYRYGRIVCCTTDIPFALNDINEKGLMAGMAGFGEPALFQAPSGSPAPGLFFDQAIPFQILNPQFSVFEMQFIGIDNLNRVFGTRFDPTGQDPGGQTFVLDQVVPPVPEPSSIVLLATMLVGIAWRCRRKRRNFS
jgi:hypothetical protein